MVETSGLDGYIVDLSVLETKGWIGKLYDTETGEAIVTPIKLPVRQMLINCLFHPGLQISVQNGGILARRVADRILDESSDAVILNQDEWKNLKDAVSTFPGFSHHELPIVDRVLNAEKTSLTPES